MQVQSNRTPLPVKVRDGDNPNASMFAKPTNMELARASPVSTSRSPAARQSRVVFSPQQALRHSSPKIASISDQIETCDIEARVPKSKLSPRGALPSKDLSVDDLTNFVNNVLNSPKDRKAANSPSTQHSVSSRQAVISTPTRTTANTSVRSSQLLNSNRPAPRSLSPQVKSVNTETTEELAGRRPGPVIVTMDTQIPQLRSGMSSELGNVPKQMQHDNMIVNTPYGQFIIPNYDIMSQRDRNMAWKSYEMKFKQINDDWKHTGDVFEGPRPDEDIVALAVRYQETEKYLSTKTGTDFWFIVLCALWAFIEYQAKKYKLPAEGYTESQIGMYKMYQSQLIRMGTVSNVGSEWPPWLQVCVTSGFSLAILVLMSKFGVGGHSGTIMKEISGMISGNRNVEVSEAGTPKPSEGGMIDMVKGLASGGNIGTMMSLFTGMMGGGGNTEKKKKKKKNKKKASKEAEEAADVDI